LIGRTHRVVVERPCCKPVSDVCVAGIRNLFVVLEIVGALVAQSFGELSAFAADL
jgi:hypothetical protein